MGLGHVNMNMREHVTIATFKDKDVADTFASCRFGNFHFKFVAFHAAKAQKTAASFNIFFNIYNFLNY